MSINIRRAADTNVLIPEVVPAHSSLLHARSRIVSLDELHGITPSAPKGKRHKPMNFGEFVDALRNEALSRGYQITRQEFALGHQDHKLFGVLDLAIGSETLADRSLALGFRSSDDSTLGAHLVAGTRVLVCDNLSLSGDLLAMKRKNTIGIDLELELAMAFNKFKIHASALDVQIARLQATEFSDAQAKVQIFDIFAAKAQIVPVRLFDDVNTFYFTPGADMDDCKPRSAWGVANAFTRAIKALGPVPAFESNLKLGRAFGLTSQVN